MIILHFHLQPQLKNELFHIYFTSFHSSSPHHKLATSQSVIYLISARSVLYNKGNKINKKLKSVAGTCKTRPIYVLFAVSSDTNMEGATVHSCSTLISLCTATVMSLRSFQSVRYILITRCLCSL